MSSYYAYTLENVRVPAEHFEAALDACHRAIALYDDDLPLPENLWDVCPEEDHHPLADDSRLVSSLADDGSYVEWSEDLSGNEDEMSTLNWDVLRAIAPFVCGDDAWIEERVEEEDITTETTHTYVDGTLLKTHDNESLLPDEYPATLAPGFAVQGLKERFDGIIASTPLLSETQSEWADAYQVFIDSMQASIIDRHLLATKGDADGSEL